MEQRFASAGTTSMFGASPRARHGGIQEAAVASYMELAFGQQKTESPEAWNTMCLR
jgi:hypothetical protein